MSALTIFALGTLVNFAAALTIVGILELVRAR
jgi:hypothetical protein